jgi:UDP-N-acetylglucosamine--N-acetylmuramyl-(pentapeptide) pyrophosphoryl-undecaprenol N-acetylglucosamine transferase
VIFVTLGTHQQPFDRAVDLVAALQERDNVLVQHGATPPRPGLPHVEWSEYLDWEPLTARMRDADVVITHAGVGSAVTAIRAGKKPVLVPRLARFGEHVDDHQLQLAARLADFGLAVVWSPEAGVDGVIAQARRSVPRSLSERPGTALARAVAGAALSGRVPRYAASLKE